MARAPRAVVQAERLSDQVYALLREDLMSGLFSAGERLVEWELAERFKVSRTPVREAIVQLSRDGLLVGNERGYVTPTYTRVDVMHRLEVKRVIEPTLARHVAEEADAQQLKLVRKAYEKQCAAHTADKHRAFIQASLEYRQQYRAICKNALLVRCARLVDDQFELSRSRIHSVPSNRERALNHNGKLLDALEANDPDAAAAQVHRLIDAITAYYNDNNEPTEFH